MNDEIRNLDEVKEETTGIIEPVEIDHEMRTAYIDYSMSVIVSRALPDARDGLKPVQRRVLFGMDGLGLNYGGQTKSLPVLWVKCSVSFTLMEIPAFMMPWLVLHRIGIRGTRSCMVREISVPWTVTLWQP